MLDKIILIGIIYLIEIIGYMVRVWNDEEFAKYHLRRIPFMWLWHASK